MHVHYQVKVQRNVTCWCFLLRYVPKDIYYKITEGIYAVAIYHIVVYRRGFS
jgi:hypothetical protein